MQERISSSTKVFFFSYLATCNRLVKTHETSVGNGRRGKGDYHGSGSMEPRRKGSDNESDSAQLRHVESETKTRRGQHNFLLVTRLIDRSLRIFRYAGFEQNPIPFLSSVRALMGSRCWDVHLKPVVDAVGNRRQAKAAEPQIMLTWAHRSSGEANVVAHQCVCLFFHHRLFTFQLSQSTRGRFSLIVILDKPCLLTGVFPSPPPSLAFISMLPSI